MNIAALQKRSVDAGIEVFGKANVIDPGERAFRFAEEAIELCRACGIPFTTLVAMICHEYYERACGEIPQEIAGTQNTLLALANSHGVDVGTVTVAEIERVLARKDQCRAKHDAKPAIFKSERAA